MWVKLISPGQHMANPTWGVRSHGHYSNHRVPPIWPVFLAKLEGGGGLAFGPLVRLRQELGVPVVADIEAISQKTMELAELSTVLIASGIYVKARESSTQAFFVFFWGGGGGGAKVSGFRFQVGGATRLMWIWPSHGLHVYSIGGAALLSG